MESLDQRPLRHTCARPLRRPPEAGVLPASACPPGEPPGPVSPRGLGSDLWDSDCPSAWLHKLYSVGGPAASRAAWRLLPGCRPRRGLPGVRECGSVPPCGSVSRSPVCAPLLDSRLSLSRLFRSLRGSVLLSLSLKIPISVFFMYSSLCCPSVCPSSRDPPSLDVCLAVSRSPSVCPWMCLISCAASLSLSLSLPLFVPAAPRLPLPAPGVSP